MEYKTITFKKIKNLGNYESEQLEVVGDLEAGDDINEGIDRLKRIVEDKLFPVQEIVEISEEKLF